MPVLAMYHNKAVIKYRGDKMETKQLVTMATDNLAGWYQGYCKHIVYCIYIYYDIFSWMRLYIIIIFWFPYRSTRMLPHVSVELGRFHYTCPMRCSNKTTEREDGNQATRLQSSITTRHKFVSGSSAAFCFVLWRLAPISKTPSRLSRLGCWMKL